MRLIDADALMKELYREIDLVDDWKTAHEIVNVVKYFPTIESDQDRCKICERLNNIRFFEYYCPKCGAKMVEVKQ